MRRLVSEAASKVVKRSYAIDDLVTGEYGRYLSGYQPRKPKQKRRANVQQPIDEFDALTPYTITIGGYLKGCINVQRLWDALRSRAVEDASPDKPGSFSRLTSPSGRVYEAGWPLDRVVYAEKWLPNQTCIPMHLPGYTKPVLVRVFTGKFGVVGCKSNEDLAMAWSYMVEHINALEDEVRVDDTMQLELEHTYGAMLNYVFHVGYAMDVRRLAQLIVDRNLGFSARHNPSIQAHLHIGYPCSKTERPPSSTGSVSSSGDSSPNSPSSTRRRKSATAEPKEHVFNVFHTGNCLYSGKGDLDECRAVFDMFKGLMEELQPKVEVATTR